MSQWKEAREPNPGQLTDSEDGWTDAMLSPKQDPKSPMSDAVTDSYVDIGEHVERSVSPFSLISEENPRQVEPSSHTDSAAAINGSSGDEDDDEDMEEDVDADGDPEDWDTYSVHTITTTKKTVVNDVVADDLVAMQHAEQIRREIMDAEVARWISEAPFPDDFDITFENLVAHGLISPEIIEMLEQVNPNGFNPDYRYVEEKPEETPQVTARKLRKARIESFNAQLATASSSSSSSSAWSATEVEPKVEVEPISYPPRQAEPDGAPVLSICSICKGFYRPCDNPFVSTLASPSSYKSPYFDASQASPFPFGLDLECPAMHGSCIDCIEKHIMTSLRATAQAGSLTFFPIRCPACTTAEDEGDWHEGQGRKHHVWEVTDHMAERILGPQSLDHWRQAKAQQQKAKEAATQPTIIRNYDSNQLLVESILVLNTVEVEVPTITPICLQSGAIWQTRREVESDKDENFTKCNICMESMYVVTYPAVASSLAPRQPGSSFPPYGIELECPQSHTFCEPCLTKYLMESIKAARVGTRKVVICPSCAGDMATETTDTAELELEDGQELTDEVVSKILGDDDMVKWKTWKARLAARRTKAIFPCPQIECNSELSIPQTKEVYDRGQCPTCQSQICVECFALWHVGFTCEENAALKTEEDRTFYTFAKSRLLRRCPKCRLVVVKDSGCNRVTCVCGYQFCWRCGELYRSVKTDFQGCDGNCTDWVEDKTLIPGALAGSSDLNMVH